MMNRFKRILTFVAALTLAALVASCVNELPVSSDTSPAATEDVTSETAEQTEKTEQTEQAEQTEAQTTVPTSSAGDRTISVLCCGDNIIHEAVFTYARTLGAQSGSEYDFEPIYRDIASVVREADIAFINQETPIAGDDYEIAGYPRFNTPAQLGDLLVDMGFDVISLANNHMLDCGAGGLENTIEYWSQKPVAAVGAYKNEKDAEQIRIIEKDGIRIAFLSYTEMINSGRTVPPSSEAVAAIYDRDTAKKQIAQANEAADLVFVSMHWGDEDSFEVTSEQERTARELAAAGADVIIGHHPHVVETIEWLDGKNGQTLCVYSLGNLLSTMYYSRNMVGMMVSFDIVQKNGDRPYITNVAVIPTVTYYTYNEQKPADKYRENIKIYLLEDFDGELARTHGSNKKDGFAVTLEKLKKYITDNVPVQYLPQYLK